MASKRRNGAAAAGPLNTLTRREFLTRAASVGVLLGAGGLTGCGRGKGGAKRDEIRVLTWSGYDDQDALKPFVEKYGVKVRATYVGGNDELFSRLKAGGPGAFDLVTPYMGFIQHLINHDLLAPLDVARLKNLDQVFDQFRHGYWTTAFGDGTITGVPYCWGSLPLIYNADKVRPEPTSWSALYDPRYKGKVAVLEDMRGLIFITAQYIKDRLGPLDDLAHLTPRQLDMVFEQLAKLKGQLRTIAPIVGDFINMMESGDIWLGGAWELATVQCQRDGYPVKQIIPEEGSFAWVDSWCLVKGAQDLDLVYAFIDHMTSIEAQQLVVKNLGLGCVNREAAEGLPEDVRALYNLTDLDQTFEKCVLPGVEPTEPGGKYTTLQDWTRKWEEWKAL
ncbi:MAG: extracellular solute-binding protein [Armatimonadota bacterium]|nr:MAG: extracellular solute-binding protein [Armatimonadota bacterium]